MTTTDSSSAPPGLRERKKARTRAAIQAAALHLFREQGYAATTVEHIVTAADVSERTFFRYFPSKADTLLYDELEPKVAESFVTQPPELTCTGALRAAVRDVHRELSPAQTERERERQVLIAQVSGVQAVTAQKIQAVLDLFSDAVARRTGRSVDDPAVRAWIGAMTGVVLISYVTWSANPTGIRFLDHVDAGLALLEDGLPL